MSGTLKIGWGQADITPRGGLVSLCGQFHTRIAAEVLDPMHAVAMVIRTDKAQSIWVSCDLVQATARLSEEVAAELGIQLDGFSPNQLAIAGTHIHTGPYLQRDGMLSLTGDQSEDEGTLSSAECRRQVKEGIVRAVLDAVNDLREGTLELAVAHIITGVNRRTVYKDGSAKMYGNVNEPQFYRMESRDGGPTQLLYAYDQDHKLRGVVANVPCTAQCDEMAEYITADYWGVARQILAKHWGEDVKVLPLCRAAGDLSPHPMVDKIAGFDATRWGRQRTIDMGEWIAENLLSHQRKALRTYGSGAAHGQAALTLDFPIWKVSEREYQEALAYLGDPSNYKEDGSPVNTFSHANAWTRRKRIQDGETLYSAKIFATRVDDVAFLSLPFELYIEYADRIRMALPECVVFDVQLAYDCLGYLATPAAVQGGDYSANIFNGICSPEGGEFLIDQAVALIKSLF